MDGDKVDRIEDYVKSKSNVALLRTFACKKIRLEKPGLSQDFILQTFDLLAEDIMDSEVEKVSQWAPTTENIAQININVWAILKPKIIKVIESRSIDPSQKINELFDSSMSRSQALRESEARSLERESIALSIKKTKH